MLCILLVCNSNAMCCIIRGYKVIIWDIRSVDNEKNTITVLRIVYTMCTML